MKFSVVVLSIKRGITEKKRQRNPEYPNLRILVEEKHLLEKVWSLPKREQILKLKLKRKYRGIVKSEGIQHCDSKIDAYYYAIKLRDQLVENNRKVKVYKDSASNNNVYVFEMNDKVWSYNKFKKLNKKNKFQKCFYVGQTSKNLLERFSQHISDHHENKTTWGKYFLRPFEISYRNDLLKKFTEETGCSCNNLLYSQSILIEYEMTIWLRKNGYGAYSA